MANIVQKDNKAYRVWDKTNNEWNELNLKTNTNSVFDNSGTKLATKIDAINGITSDLSGEADDIAASIACVNKLNNSLGGLNFAQDAEGNWGYIPDGADSVTPFKTMSLSKYTFGTAVMRGSACSVSANFNKGIHTVIAMVLITNASSSTLCGHEPKVANSGTHKDFNVTNATIKKKTQIGTDIAYIVKIDVENDNTPVTFSFSTGGEHGSYASRAFLLY